MRHGPRSWWEPVTAVGGGPCSTLPGASAAGHVRAGKEGAQGDCGASELSVETEEDGDPVNLRLCPPQPGALSARGASLLTLGTPPANKDTHASPWVQTQAGGGVCLQHGKGGNESLTAATESPMCSTTCANDV